MALADGQTIVADPVLRLRLSTARATSPRSAIRLSFDGGATWGAWRAFAPRLTVRLPAETPYGPQRLTAQLRDAEGDVAEAILDIRYVPAARSSMALETRYLLQTDVAFDAGSATVRETIDLVNRSGAPIDHVDLAVLPRAFGEFRLRSVSVDGRPADASFPVMASMQVPLGRNLAVGDRARIVVVFVLAPSDDTSSSLQVRLSKAEGIMRFGHWFPIVSDGHDLRWPGDAQFTAAAVSMRLELRMDRRLVVAAPGRRLASAADIHVYELEAARDYAFALSPAFRRSTASADGIAVEAYTLPGSDPSVALRVAADALRTYSKAYGPYPWSRYLLVQSPRSRSGNEYPSVVFLGSESLTDAGVIAHETAHQWFYGILGNDQLREPWLDEAFAEFSADHFFGEFEPYCSTRPVDASIYAFPNERAKDDECDSYTQTVYVKGAALVDGVRQRLGDERFFAAMRALVQEHRAGIVTTQQVVETWLRYSPDPASLERYLAEFLDTA
jgi:hypothetical protein